MQYSFDAFINSIKYLDKDDILATAYKQHKALDKITVRDKKDGGTDMQNNVQYLLLFLETGERSLEMSDENFAKLKPICENLIKNNQLNPQTINLFN